MFLTHTASAPPLFGTGQPASFGLMRIAEEGNAGPLQSATVTAMMGPGQPGAMTLVKTNDGFTE